MALPFPTRGHILQLNLRALGITDFGEMKSRGFSRAVVPAHSELFFDHRPMTLARWPNTGDFSKIAGYPAASDQVDEHGGNVGQLPGGFHYAGDRPRRWHDYMDDCVSGTEIFGNIFHKVHSAMFIGGGRDHRVANNLFVDCDPAVRVDGRGLDKSPVWHNMVGNTKDSPAWALGFQRIPVEQIGLRDNELRRGLRRLSTTPLKAGNLSNQPIRN